MSSGFFEPLGYPLAPLSLIEDGHLKNFTIAGKFSYLLDKPRTSALSNVIVQAGVTSYDDFMEDGVFELLRFSTFHPNSITGAFSGEIRLGYWHKKRKKIPIKGGSVSGVSQKDFLRVRFSRESLQREGYYGPKGVFFEKNDPCWQLDMHEYKRLLSYIKKYRNRFLVGILCSLLASILNIASLSSLMPVFQTMTHQKGSVKFQIPFNQEEVKRLLEEGREAELRALFTRLNKNYKEMAFKSVENKFTPIFFIKYSAHFKLMINSFSSYYEPLDFLLIVCLTLLPIYLLKLLSITGTVYYISSTGLMAVRDVRQELVKKLIKLPLNHFIREKSGVLMSRIMNDVIVISDSLSQRLRVSIVNLFIIVTHFLFLALIDYKLVAICMLGVPLALWPVNHFSRKIRQITSGEQIAMGELNGQLQELISGIRVVRAFGMEHYEVKKFEKLNDFMYQKTFKYHLNHTIGPSLVEFVTSFVVLGLLLYGASHIVSEDMSPGSFFTFFFTLIIILSPIKQIATWVNEINRTAAAGERIFEIIDYPSEEDTLRGVEGSSSKKLPSMLQESIEFTGVHFKYPEADDKKKEVLKDINLKVNIGATIALVGHSGAGKSTLVDLISRFYNIEKGVITFDGINIRDVELSNLREKIGIVTQEIILFNGSIRENICFGRDNISVEEMVQAAGQAYATEFIDQLPQKYETIIGERGLVLSGGQRQRVSIARALLKNPEVLILDEATSSLDTQSEKLVQQALSHLMEGRTTFVIAHRLSTIYEADEIIVLEKGKIRERGTHQELLAKKGVYKGLYEMQFQT